MPDIFKLDLDFSGIDEIISNLNLYDEASIQAATRAMIENTEDLLGKSMRVVPHDKGMLEGSGSARVQNIEVAHGVASENDAPSITGNVPLKSIPGFTITGTVSYNEPYAAIQHENLEFEHKPGRQAKYLESPLFQMIGKYTQNIADAIKAIKAAGK